MQETSDTVQEEASDHGRLWTLSRDILESQVALEAKLRSKSLL